MKAELKKVVWPTPKQLVNNTVAVIAFVLIFAIIVFVLDVCFDSINKYGILKLQQKVQSSFSSSDNTENSTAENNETANNETIEGTETNAPEAVVEEQANNEAEQVEVQETPVTSETE
jgi:preprotein translocase SecE subunit